MDIIASTKAAMQFAKSCTTYFKYCENRYPPHMPDMIREAVVDGFYSVHLYPCQIPSFVVWDYLMRKNMFALALRS
jgi:hypothetical protein